MEGHWSGELWYKWTHVFISSECLYRRDNVLSGTTVQNHEGNEEMWRE